MVCTPVRLQQPLPPTRAGHEMTKRLKPEGLPSFRVFVPAAVLKNLRSRYTLPAAIPA
jgi:hypothetical protein